MPMILSLTVLCIVYVHAATNLHAINSHSRVFDSPTFESDAEPIVTTSSVISANSMNGQFLGISTDSTGQYVGVVDKTNGLYLSTNRGINYTSYLPASFGYYYFDVEIATNLPEFVAVATGGGLFYSINFGGTFEASQTPSGTYAWWTGVAISSDGQYGYITSGYSDRPLYMSNNNMVSFAEVASSSSDYYVGIACASSGQYVYALSQIYLYVSSDFGTSWTKTMTPFRAYDGYFLSCSGNGQYAFASPYSVLTSDYGNTWESKSTPFGPQASAFSYTGQVMALTGDTTRLIMDAPLLRPVPHLKIHGAV
jgi:hypothetical protein